jgi:hypothetical protein
MTRTPIFATSGPMISAVGAFLTLGRSGRLNHAADVFLRHHVRDCVFGEMIGGDAAYVEMLEKKPSGWP